MIGHFCRVQFEPECSFFHAAVSPRRVAPSAALAHGERCLLSCFTAGKDDGDGDDRWSGAWLLVGGGLASVSSPLGSRQLQLHTNKKHERGEGRGIPISNHWSCGWSVMCVHTMHPTRIAKEITLVILLNTTFLRELPPLAQAAE